MDLRIVDYSPFSTNVVVAIKINSNEKNVKRVRVGEKKMSLYIRVTFIRARVVILIQCNVKTGCQKPIYRCRVVISVHNVS